MVQIGKDNPLYNLYTQSSKPVSTTPAGEKPVVPQEEPLKGNSLQAKLAAIDNAGAAESTVFNQAASGYQPQNNNLMARLEAIGTGELKPKTGSDFDLIA